MYFAGTDAQLLDSKDFAIQDYISMNSPIEMHGHPLFQMLNSVVALSLESFTLTQCKVGNRIHRSYIQILENVLLLFPPLSYFLNHQ